MRTYRTIPELTRAEIDHFWSKVDKSAGPEGCWLWTGYISVYGYATTKIRQVSYYIHRVAYTLAIGPIPEQLTIDHVAARGCRHRHCVNPAHLEAVSERVNVLRGQGPPALNNRKTHCVHGHEFTEENTDFTANGRICLTCARKRRTEANNRQRERRAMRPSKALGLRTHCKNGHEYTPDNIRWYRGHARQCIACEKENSRRNHLKRKAMRDG